MEKVRGVTPSYEKMQADSSHQQQQQYQKVLRNIVVEGYSKVHSKFQIKIFINNKVMINWTKTGLWLQPNFTRVKKVDFFWGILVKYLRRCYLAETLVIY